MARRIPGQRIEGAPEITVKPGNVPGSWDVYVKPSEERIKDGGLDPDTDKVEPVVLYTLDETNERVRLYPVYTRPEPDGSFTPKHKKIKAISFDWFDAGPNPDETAADMALDFQPDGLTRDPNYGLGIKKEYRFVLDAVADHSDKDVLYIGDGGPMEDEFKLSLDAFDDLITEIDRIDRRAQVAENEVKATTSYNVVAEVVGAETRPFRLGRNEIRQLIQKYVADPDYRDPDAQTELVTELGRSARTFAQQAPEATEQLISELELTRLELAIQEFEELMAKHHNENKWQKFFEDDPFLLSFAFGYPVVCVNGQSYVGGRRIDGKGEKIGDFLYKNSVNNNAALIEIKKPQSPVVKKYRDGVYGPHDELSGGITQVLDQRYHFTRKFPLHQSDNDWHGENEVADYEIDCVLIVGTMPTEKDKRRSFQLYRKNSHGVRIVTFDEVLEMLKNLLAYLREAKPGKRPKKS
ncbi:Shedu immune nuclease family protein [Celeribacter sp. SCSIO 80788]|uniref:Shedu immune nuclease family protein n=1 Tax=Celeribacter sp. SCSIO 80788 TaxID=3117013 RepID=UPI003DA67F4A